MPGGGPAAGSARRGSVRAAGRRRNDLDKPVCGYRAPGGRSQERRFGSHAPQETAHDSSMKVGLAWHSPSAAHRPHWVGAVSAQCIVPSCQSRHERQHSSALARGLELHCPCLTPTSPAAGSAGPSARPIAALFVEAGASAHGRLHRCANEQAAETAGPSAHPIAALFSLENF